MKTAKILSVLALLCAACGGGLPSIPLPSGGSITITDGGATICTTIPLAVMVEAGVAR